MQSFLQSGNRRWFSQSSNQGNQLIRGPHIGSLLSPAIKILERLILPSLTSSLFAAPTQHDFRQNRLTTTALLPLAQLISEGFNINKLASRTIAAAIDISKAFDTVDITLLLGQISG
jgi:hypothetical protein